MKKMMKKALAFVMAFAMVAGFFAAVGVEEAKADTKDASTVTDWKVKGSFDTWADHELTESETGVYTYTYDVAPEEEFVYQFCIHGTLDEKDTYVNEQDYDKAQTSNFTVTATGAGKVTITLKPAEMADNYWNNYYVPLNNSKGVYAEFTASSTDDDTTGDDTTGDDTTGDDTTGDDTTGDDTTGDDVTGDDTPAGPVNKNLHVTVNGDTSVYEGVAIQTWGGVTTPNTVAVNTLSTGWGEDDTTGVTVLTLTDGKADVVITVDKTNADYGVYTGMQLIAYTATNIAGVNTGNIPESLMAALDSDATDIWITFTLPTDKAAGAWSVTTIDPSAITADDVEALIEAIGEVSLDSLATITAAEQAVADYLAVSDDYSTDDIANYATLTAARAKYDELKAADDKAKAEADAQAAGELTLYVKAPETWTDMGLWAWTSAGNLFEAWPGQSMTACENNEGYFKATIKITGVTSVIFNSSNKEQTKDITDLSAGVYWFDLTLAEGDTQYSAEFTKETPEGWVEEDKAELDVLDPDDKEDVEDKEDKEDEEDKAPTAWDDAKLKVHVQMPDVEGWEKLGAYLYGSDENKGWTGAELTGEWPGVELQLEKNSENGWYAFGGTFADGYYWLIINNFVSDDEAAAGATKIQAADLDITDGEYWITIAMDEESGKYVATVATEAPADYDGEGLESVVDTPDDEDTPDDDKDEVPPTGDNAPIAVVAMIALVAGASAVVIRKRRVA